MTGAVIHSKLAEDPVEVPAIGLTMRQRVPPAATLGAACCIETINMPGFGPPLHRHPETEIFYVLDGRYLFEADGRRFVAQTGEVVSIPGGCSHAFVNISDGPARQLIHILPALDAIAFFSELAVAMPGGKPDHAMLAAFGRKWHVEFLGPPLKASDR